MKNLWISWHYSQRSRSLSRLLNVPIFEFVEERNFLVRHFFSSLWTFYLLIKEKPLRIFIQYSFLLLCVVYVYKKIRREYVFVICDCHTKALLRKLNNRFSKLFNLIKKESFAATDICIITNHELIKSVELLNRSYAILPDPIPNLKFCKLKHSVNKHYCLYSNSYAVDEPYEEVIEAARKLRGIINIICTGKIPKKLVFLKEQPYDNIFFTDYVEDKEYNNLIANAKCVLALTNDEATLLCSGYEALSVNTPLIISDTKVIREYYSNNVVYTDNSSEDISCKIQQCIQREEEIKMNMEKLKELKLKDQEIKIKSLSIKMAHR